MKAIPTPKQRHASASDILIPQVLFSRAYNSQLIGQYPRLTSAMRKGVRVDGELNETRVTLTTYPMLPR